MTLSMEKSEVVNSKSTKQAADSESSDPEGSSLSENSTDDSDTSWLGPCTVCDVNDEQPVNKEQCLKLIDEIWKGGLDYRLSLMRRRKLRGEPFESENHWCSSCTKKELNMNEINSDDSGASSSPRAITNDLGSTLATDQTSARVDTNECISKPYAQNKADCNTVGSECKMPPYLSCTNTLTSAEENLPPFKKARYSWQIKRSNCSKQTVSESSHSNSKDESSSSTQGMSSTKLSYPVSKKRKMSHSSDSIATLSEGFSNDTSGQIMHGLSESDSEMRCPSPYPQAPEAGNSPKNNKLKSSVIIPTIDISLSQPLGESNRDDLSDIASARPVVSIKVRPQQYDMPKSESATNSSFQTLSALTSGKMARTEDMVREASLVTMERYPSGHRPSNQDFHTLSRALGRLSYMERWQCQHVAKAIVDNAINKTLEEMGLSPNPESGQYQRQRTRIEDAGVSQAIRQRGLQRYPPDRVQRLNPIITRLTEVSENLFSQNLRTRQLPQEAVVSSESSFRRDTPSLTSSENSVNCADVRTNQQSTEDLSSHRNLTTIQSSDKNTKQPQDTLNPDTEHPDFGNKKRDTITIVSGIKNIESADNENNNERATANDSAASDLISLENNAPSTSFLLDQAVNAAIHEQGLHLN